MSVCRRDFLVDELLEKDNEILGKVKMVSKKNLIVKLYAMASI